MPYVSISSVRGERRVKLHKAGVNALFNAIDVLDTIKDNLPPQSPLGGCGGFLEQAVMAMKSTIATFHADVAPTKRKPDTNGQGVLLNEPESVELETARTSWLK